MNAKTIISWVGMVCGIGSLMMTSTFLGPVLGVIGLAAGTWVRKSSKDFREQQRGKIAQVASFFGITGFLMLFLGIAFMGGTQG